MKVVCSLIAVRHKQRNVNGLRQSRREETRRVFLTQMASHCLFCPITCVGNKPDWAACQCSHKYLITHSPFVYNNMSNCRMRVETLLWFTYKCHRVLEISALLMAIFCLQWIQEKKAVCWPSLHVYWALQKPNFPWIAALEHVILFSVDYGRCLTYSVESVWTLVWQGTQTSSQRIWNHSCSGFGALVGRKSLNSSNKNTFSCLWESIQSSFLSRTKEIILAPVFSRSLLSKLLKVRSLLMELKMQPCKALMCREDTKAQCHAGHVLKMATSTSFMFAVVGKWSSCWISFFPNWGSVVISETESKAVYPRDGVRIDFCCQNNGVACGDWNRARHRGKPPGGLLR